MSIEYHIVTHHKDGHWSISSMSPHPCMESPHQRWLEVEQQGRSHSPKKWMNEFITFERKCFMLLGCLFMSSDGKSFLFFWDFPSKHLFLCSCFFFVTAKKAQPSLGSISIATSDPILTLTWSVKMFSNHELLVICWRTYHQHDVEDFKNPTWLFKEDTGE